MARRNQMFGSFGAKPVTMTGRWFMELITGPACFDQLKIARCVGVLKADSA